MLLLSVWARSRVRQVEWLREIGVEDVGYLLLRHPHVLSHSLANLQAKYDFVTKVWGRQTKEVEVFPQVLTYSLHYLRARAGYLHANGKAADGGLHRLLRTADRLFAQKLAGGEIAAYQAFARAVKLGGNESEYDAHEVQARAPGGGGGAFDWGETSLDAMVEQIGTPTLMWRGVLHPELTAVEKFMAFNNEMLARDAKLEAELDETRRTVADFLASERGALGEAEVLPSAPPAAAEPSDGESDKA